MQEGGLMKPVITTTMLMAAVDRAGFRKSNRDGATAFKEPVELPCFDEQKKTRLRSHLSA
jgi:hypothetical protein